MRPLTHLLLIAVISSAVTATAIHYLPLLSTDHTQAKNVSITDAMPTSATPDKTLVPQRQQELQQLLEEKEQIIATLEQEIDWLQSIIEQIDSRTDAEQDSNNRQTYSQQQWFDEDLLLNAGFNTQEVMTLKERVEAHALALLNLRNRGIREGWGRGGKLFQELRELERQFQASFTPQEYDAVLYASGKNNRVEVTDILGNSAAEYAGIRTGDIILSYDGEKILELSPLHQLTAKGDSGEMVAIRLLRNGETITVYAPRGTLGTRLKLTRAEPEPY